jgi:phage FluMu protein Com
MKDFRCHNCNHLLYKANGDVEVEVICSKCRRINYPSRKDECVGFRGKNFQARAIKHICCNCLRLQFLSIGSGDIETKCVCHKINKYNTVEMRKGNYTYPLTENGKKLKNTIAN